MKRKLSRVVLTDKTWQMAQEDQKWHLDNLMMDAVKSV